MSLSERLKLPLPQRYSPWFFLLMLLSIITLGWGGLLMIELLGQGALLSKEAFKSGQQARIFIAESRIEGNIRMAEPPSPEPVAETTIPPTSPVVPEPAKPVPETTPSPIGAPEIPAPPVETPAPAFSQIITKPLNPAPNAELVTKDEKGPALPVKSEKGLEPWKYYGKALPDNAGEDRVAVIVTGLGLHDGYFQQVLNLPEFVAVSFTPYAPNLSKQVNMARQAGHEVWLDIPMEPEDYPASDPGDLAMLKSLPEKDIKARLHEILAKAPGIVGLVTTREEVFSNYRLMDVVAGELKKRGLLLVVRNRNYVSDKNASHLVYMSRELDASRYAASPPPDQMLVELEAVAKSNHKGLALVGFAPAVLTEIQNWTKELPAKGISLVGPTGLVNEKK